MGAETKRKRQRGFRSLAADYSEYERRRSSRLPANSSERGDVGAVPCAWETGKRGSSTSELTSSPPVSFTIRFRPDRRLRSSVWFVAALRHPACVTVAGVLKYSRTSSCIRSISAMKPLEDNR